MHRARKYKEAMRRLRRGYRYEDRRISELEMRLTTSTDLCEIALLQIERDMYSGVINEIGRECVKDAEKRHLI